MTAKVHFDKNSQASAYNLGLSKVTACRPKGFDEPQFSTSHKADVTCKPCLKRLAKVAAEDAAVRASRESFLDEMEEKYPTSAPVTRIHPENAEIVTKGEHVVAGPMSFWDVREAKDWTERQSFTQHNVYLARTMVSIVEADIVQALIEERDTLIYTLGQPYNSIGGHLEQYLKGRIAGIEFALAQFGVKGF